MGATNFSMTVAAKTVDEAYRVANEMARDYNGHQDGYSGDIQTTNGFVEFKLRPRLSVEKFERWVWDCVFEPEGAFLKRRGIQDHDVPLIRRAAVVANEKWGRCVCVEITGKAATDWKKSHGYAGKRGVRVYKFFGTGAE